jgi:hypothetical protein
MTKGRAALPGRFVAKQIPFFIAGRNAQASRQILLIQNLAGDD